MAAGFPLGSFARGRRDWSIEQLMIGSMTSATFNSVNFSLNNNSKLGNYLAVYGILAWRNYHPQTMQAFVQVGKDTPYTQIGATPTHPLIAGRAAIEGYIGSRTNGITGTPIGITFAADGAHWLSMGDLPLFVIPPSYQVVVAPTTLTGQVVLGDAMACTFLWGYYGSAKLPKGIKVS
jgi:hypothetical protein